jgi:hypothetical protein
MVNLPWRERVRVKMVFWMKKKEEEKSYALHFLVAVLLLIIVSLWLILWETETLRPWKEYQKKYYDLVVAQLEKNLGQRVAEFSSDNVQKDYNNLKSALDKARAEFESPAVQTEYKKTSRELNEVSDELKIFRLDFQKLRAEYLKVEYDYIKHGTAEDKQTLEGLNEEIAILDKKIKQLESEKREKRAKLNESTAPVDELTRKINEFTSGMDNLKNQIISFSNQKVEIKQLHIPDLGRTDRCQSCHMGIDESRKVSSIEPFSTHPGKEIFLGSHLVSRFGCTVCHRGQGRATSSAKKGHGDVKYWDYPMLRGDNVQASCLLCHENVKELRGAETLAVGIERLVPKVCYGCHE